MTQSKLFRTNINVSPDFVKETLEEAFLFMARSKNSTILYMLPRVRDFHEILFREAQPILAEAQTTYEVNIKNHRIRFANGSQLIFKPLTNISLRTALHGLTLDGAFVAGAAFITKEEFDYLKDLVTTRLNRKDSSRNNSTRSIT